MQPKLFDFVALLDDIEGTPKGTMGTIVEIYQTPCLAYLVEFCDSEGKTIALLDVLPDKILVLRKAQAA
jgi:hypothetical protein